MSIACEECEKATAIWRCNDCAQSLCGICDATLHSKGSRKDHKRVPYAQPTMKAITPDIVQVRLTMPIQPATVEAAASNLPHSLTKPGDRTSAYLFEDPERDQKNQLAALDNLFKDLKQDMDNVGSNTEVQKFCPGCNGIIEKNAQYIGALGRRFHPQCFRCAHCSREFGELPYVEHEGKAYCLPDHKLLFSTKCYVCGGFVKDKIVRALGRIYHADHFVCFHCKQPLSNNFVEHDEKVYCTTHYTELFATRCALCSNSITGPYIETGGKRMHTDCFKCKTCYKSLMNDKAFNLNGNIYCELHYHHANNSICGVCSKPIVGPAAQAFGRSFHPPCFICTTCKTPLTGTFYEKNSQPYCELHK